MQFGQRETSMHRRSIHRAVIIIGAILGAILPHVVGGSSVPFFTDIEARIAYGALATLVFAAFGALAGWAVGSLVSQALSRGDRSSG